MSVVRVDAAAAPGTIVLDCFAIDRGPDPQVVVRTQTKNFGFDTLVVRKAVRMCEPALKLPDDVTTGDGTVVMQPNATLTLATPVDGQPGPMVSMDGTLALLRESPTLPSKGKVLAVSMQGGGMVGDSFFDVFAESSTVGGFEIDSFFDITLRLDVGDGPMTTMAHLQSQGGGIYMGQLDPAVEVGGAKLSQATLALNDPATPNPNGPTATRALECFKTEKGTNPTDPYLLVTKNFGTDKVLVQQSETLCEGALKTKEPIPVGSTVPVNPPNLVWECFNISGGNNVGRNYRLFTQNFGAHRVRVQRAFQLCEDASKTRVDAAGVATTVGQPTGRVWECFTLQDRNPNSAFWLTTRNFGPSPVRLRNGDALCEMARKVPINTFPGDPNDPKDG